MDGLSFDVDLWPKGDSSAFHTLNAPGQDVRRMLVRTPNGRSPLSTSINLVEVHHGTMVFEGETCEATLLVLDVRFQSREQERRYTSATVTLEFVDQGKKASRDPAVVGLAPDGTHWLHKTTFDRTTKTGASGGANVGMSGAGAEAKVHWEREDTRKQNSKATVTGSRLFSRGKAGDPNAVSWSMDENQGEADGIPSFLQTAVLLRRSWSKPFVVRLRVDSTVDLVSKGLRAIPFTTDVDKRVDTIAITPGEVQVRNFGATGIKPEELGAMHRLPLESYFRVNLSEQDVLTPPAGGPPSPAGGPLSAAPPTPEQAADEPSPTALAATAERAILQDPNGGDEPVSLLPASSVASQDSGLADGRATRGAGGGVASAVATALATAVETAARAALAAATAAEAAGRAAEAAAHAAQAAARAAETSARAAEAATKALSFAQTAPTAPQ